MTDLTDVVHANPRWFTNEQRVFFSDVHYWLRRKRGTLYLERSTYAWSDMFGGPKRLHYRLNIIDPDTLAVGSLVGPEFATRDEVSSWLITEGGD